MHVERDVLYCPICGFKAATLYYIKSHYLNKHRNNYCPICKRCYKRIACHAFNTWTKQGCMHHAVLYYLTARRREARGGNNGIWFKRAGEIALVLLSDENYRWR